MIRGVCAHIEKGLQQKRPKNLAKSEESQISVIIVVVNSRGVMVPGKLAFDQECQMALAVGQCQ